MNKLSILTLSSLATIVPVSAQDDSAQDAIERAVKAIEDSINKTDEVQEATELVQPEAEGLELINREAVDLSISTEQDFVPNSTEDRSEESLLEQPEQENSLAPIVNHITTQSKPLPSQRTISSEDTDIKIYTAWKPKPLQNAPRGWQYNKGNQSQAYPTSIKLSNDQTIKLQITPYILAPEDSSSVALVTEPGYLPEQGYAQTQSVSATLNHSNSELEATEEGLDRSIDLLNQLLISLPQ